MQFEWKGHVRTPLLPNPIPIECENFTNTHKKHLFLHFPDRYTVWFFRAHIRLSPSLSLRLATWNLSPWIPYIFLEYTAFYAYVVVCTFYPFGPDDDLIRVTALAHFLSSRTSPEKRLPTGRRAGHFKHAIIWFRCFSFCHSCSKSLSGPSFEYKMWTLHTRQTHLHSTYISKVEVLMVAQSVHRSNMVPKFCRIL